MTAWIRFRRGDDVSYGTLAGSAIAVHDGSPFDGPTPSGETVDIAEVELLAPCEPTKMIGLWNNFHAAAEKQGWAIPEQPLYFFKPPSCFLAPEGSIVHPSTYEGRIIYEGELGVVIGDRCVNVPVAEAGDHIFGYTCVNDVTALTLLDEDESFPQWCRAKSFDTFGPFGPVIETDVDPAGLQVQTLLKGRQRQDYPVSDMIFSPTELVSLISRDMTLEPGDIITCGTSLGALPMKPGVTVEVVIEGIGVLRNDVVDQP